MKISQRILILIIINIFALFCTAVIISILSATEQKYHKQSNKILDYKYTLSEKQNQEKQIFTDDFDQINMEKLNFELLSKFHDIDSSLLKQSRGQYQKIESLMKTREDLFNNISNLYQVLKYKKISIENLHDLFRSKLEILNSELEQSGSIDKSLVLLYGINRECLASIEKLSFLLSGSQFVSESFRNEFDDIYFIQLDLQNLTEVYSGETYSQITEELQVLLNQLIVLTAEIIQARFDIQQLVDETDHTDDQIELMINSIKNETNTNYIKIEDQGLFAIISGLLFITLFSITATSILGRSIIVPIEQLRSYVLSIDVTNMSLTKNRSVKNKINAKKHFEIHQLADAYIKLEKALFLKMSELEERSENLTLELTERRKTEKKLKRAEEYLNNIIQSLNSIVITADKNLKLIHFNKHAEELAVGKGKGIYDRFPFLNKYSAEISEVLEKVESYFNNSILIESQRDHHFNISISPLKGDKTDGVVIRIDDISDLRKIENQLIRTQKWETLGVLTSGFAHDFNNVLTGIVTSSSILLHKAEQENLNLDDSFINCLNIIDSSGKRAAKMVQQLLSLSKSNELTFADIDLNESVEEIKSICRNSFDKSIAIEIDLLNKKLPVKADSAQIEQSLLNLCINSYHSMTDMREKSDKQGGTLKISLKEIHIDNFSIHENKEIKEGDYVSIAISDTGVGISKDQKKKIFDPFYTTKDKAKGTGLGLTMVQHIINQHNGFIELYSEPGRGTVITVFIPVSKDISAEIQHEDEIRTLAEGSGTILIIDDEELIRDLTGSILIECGYSIITAENGFKGVDIYRDQRDEIDLIILDMSMPGISGKETFIQLKQINPEQKILMSSGFTKDDRIQDLLNMGLEDFIQKPFDFIRLSEKVSKLVQK